MPLSECVAERATRARIHHRLLSLALFVAGLLALAAGRSALTIRVAH